MGRAQNQQARNSAFDGVFGVRRGGADPLLSSEPTDAARARIRGPLQALQEGNVQPVWNILSDNQRDLHAAWALQELRQQLESHFLDETYTGYFTRLQSGMKALGMFGGTSDHFILEGQTLHVMPEHRLNRNPDLPGKACCGTEISGREGETRLVASGVWANATDGPAEFTAVVQQNGGVQNYLTNAQRCPDCLAYADNYRDEDSDEANTDDELYAWLMRERAEQRMSDSLPRVFASSNKDQLETIANEATYVSVEAINEGIGTWLKDQGITALKSLVGAPDVRAYTRRIMNEQGVTREQANGLLLTWIETEAVQSPQGGISNACLSLSAYRNSMRNVSGDFQYGADLPDLDDVRSSVQRYLRRAIEQRWPNP